ncbi:MAG TPA: TonB-dependent receptor [Edaphocola sp.]|nr:TonB-dependent receptor [Edaphocola sp.]
MQYFRIFIITALSSFLGNNIFAQTATLKGRITEDGDHPISDVSIGIAKSNDFVISDSLGFYSITIPAGKKMVIIASAFGFESKPFSVNLKEGEVAIRNIFLESNGSMLQGVEIKAEKNRTQTGNITINTKNLDKMPSTIGGIEGQLKVLVGSRNELSAQYNVRGGNFDENLVYVNDFEINRPFLVRSGQQEGLSFVNTDLVSKVDFSIGGFQARYGDKMSSVLDVQYKQPEKFAGSFLASFLGFQAHVEGSNSNKKLKYLFGFRQKSNKYLLQAQPTKGVYNPSFSDLQALVNYKFSKKLEMEFIGNYALNKFNFLPEKSRTAFGSATEALAFTSNYSGGEVDKFDNTFGGLSLTYSPNEKVKLKLLASAFSSYEQETFDIMNEYMLSAVELNLGSANLGEDLYSLGSGAIHRYARNFLNANVSNIKFLGSLKQKRHFISYGVGFQNIGIEDRLLEWERRDSAGFTVPYDVSAINMYKFLFANNNLNYNKADAFIQDNIVLNNAYDMVLTLGLRSTYNFLNKELLWSPRVNFAFKPKWAENILFKMAVGIYDQPAFYREMRQPVGNLNTDLKAQKSAHFAMGMDYNFIALNERPFKLTAELFYKNLWDLVPYDYDNVRIRYAANNNGVGYAYGGEIRLFGDLVKDSESWISLGYLKTMEKIFNPLTQQYGNYQPRPTDGRITFGVFFSDYLPQNHNFKVYLNMMYATGLPVALPEKDFERKGSFRIPDYQRVDIGFSALLMDGANAKIGYYSLFKGIKSIWASFEVFNLLGFSNTLSYEYIESMNNNYKFFVPNRLTNRLLNLKLAFKF